MLATLVLKGLGLTWEQYRAHIPQRTPVTKHDQAHAMRQMARAAGITSDQREHLLAEADKLDYEADYEDAQAELLRLQGGDHGH